MDGATVSELYRRGVDVILPEYVGTVEASPQAAEACSKARLPVWLGVCHLSDDGKLETGESFGDLVAALEGIPVEAILPMCIHPGALSIAPSEPGKVWDGPMGAYANVGYFKARRPGP